MTPSRRDFIRLAGTATGSALLGACGQVGVETIATAHAAEAAPGSADTGSAGAPTACTPAPAPVAPVLAAPSVLQTYLLQHANSTFALPPVANTAPQVSWAGPLITCGSSSTSPPAATTLPAGQIVPITDPRIRRAAAQQWTSSLPGNPTIAGLPCMTVGRQFASKGIARSTTSVRAVRLRTDAPVLEISGITSDGWFSVQTLIVDGELVPATALSSSLGLGGGWNAGTVRIDFATRRLRDIWIDCGLCPAYVKVGAGDQLLAIDDALEPQLTVVGDSYLQGSSANFGNGGAIALELAARLGIRKVLTDAIGGTGYHNSGGNLGNLNDRLPSTVKDQSSIYLVMAGLNDYGDIANGIVWPSRAVYEQSVIGYLQGLRHAQPDATIVVTAPLCPVAPLSDSSYVANPSTNSSGLGDFLFKADLHRRAVQQIAGPWIYIDALMGTGWINSSGAAGDARGMQWFTGGTPGAGTSATYKPGNTNGGAGGGGGGIASVPVLDGGRYTQAPEIRAFGGTGSGLLLAGILGAGGRLAAVNVIGAGRGYSPGPGLPTIVIDGTFAQTAATLGAPTLQVGVNPDGAYPPPELVAAGVGDLNNIYRLLAADATHPSAAGIEYLSTRLALNIFEGITRL